MTVEQILAIGWEAVLVFDRDGRKNSSDSEVKLKNAFNKHSTLYSLWIFEYVFKLSAADEIAFAIV